MEITWIFRPAKLHRKKYVETTWIFRRSKLHRKSTRKWRGNSSKFDLRRIDVSRCAGWVAGLQDVLKTSWRHVLKMSSIRLQRNSFTSSKTSWRPLEDVLQRRYEDIFKMSWKTKNYYAEDVLKTSWRHILKTSSRCLGGKQNVYWGYLYLTNLNVYPTNLYFTNLYLTNLRRIQIALLRTQ